MRKEYKLEIFDNSNTPKEFILETEDGSRGTISMTEKIESILSKFPNHHLWKLNPIIRQESPDELISMEGQDG
jgi:hypothetical protein